MRHFIIIALCATLFINCTGSLTTSSSDTDSSDTETTETTSEALELASTYESRFGYNHISRESYDLTAEIGGSWFRPNLGLFNWGQIETEEGEYDWDNVDYIISNAQSHDLNIMITVFPFADWDQSECRDALDEETQDSFEELGDYRQNPCDMDAYREFLSALVDRYDGDGENDMEDLVYPVRHWEIANEPAIANTEAGMSFYSGSAEDYIELLQVSSEVIRDEDENAEIMHAGLFGILEDATDYWGDVFEDLEDLDFDIANYHSISSTSEDGQMSDADDFFTENSVTQDVWVTEFEFSEDAWGETEEDDAATIIVQVYTRTFASGATKILMAGPNFDLTTAEEGTENPFAIINEDVELTTAGISYEVLVNHIDYFESVETISDEVYKFTVDGQDVYVVWDLTYGLASLGTPETITDMEGNSYDSIKELADVETDIVFLRME